MCKDRPLCFNSASFNFNLRASVTAAVVVLFPALREAETPPLEALCAVVFERVFDARGAADEAAAEAEEVSPFSLSS